jgi:hypothetical protein
MLEGMVCSAHVTPPLPPSSNKVPTMVASRHSRRVGQAVCPRIAQANRITPATKKRLPAIRKGGRLSIA